MLPRSRRVLLVFDELWWLKGPGYLAFCNTTKLKRILINHMATENENYTLKNNNDNDNDIVTRLDLQVSVLTMRPPSLQETNKRNS